ncbi:hypothetical protein [Cognatazoarcus halotolerans]|uniref:hypothetical protein n=1 Tax=Cognatazoarcus halotolerans TaxID=2686016 RepID=UPI00135B2EF8|nr:hypothetical protein [Cognatazoarcus halotolerans]MCB1901783.1 hypothetical protein [Rhodocyclaceae bacterium]
MSDDEVDELAIANSVRFSAEYWETINPLWRLANPLTVHQAAALIAGYDPNWVRFNSLHEAWLENEHGWRESNGVSWVKTAFAALVNAINAGSLKAVIRRDARMQGWDENPNHGESLRPLSDEGGGIRNGFEPAVIYCESPDWGKTTVAVPDLVAWLEASNVRTGFFFPAANEAPDYLDPNNPRYAPKLAAAVRAWQAVTDTGGKTPKQALAKWLREHAAEFGMTDDEGKPNETGIEEAAKMANWQPGGGAPKTPGE